MPDVVLTRLLSEAAYRHVLDHADAQRADAAIGKIGEHWGFLSQAEGCWTFDARDRMPRSSPLPVHAITAAAEDPSGFDALPPARAGSFSCPTPAVRSQLRDGPVSA